MKHITLIILLLAAMMPACAKVVRGYYSDSEGIPGLIIDSIDSRKDLTRVYGALIGMPHTSSRINSATMTVGGVELECTDIDGVDQGRWFQWEDDGRIAVELDFPAVRRLPDEGVILLVTPRGNAVTKWKYTAPVKSNKKKRK